jgi:hypothetical protein
MAQSIIQNLGLVIRRFVAAAMGVAVIVVWAVLPASARLGFGGGCSDFCFFDTPAALSSDGREIVVTGSLSCDPHQQGWKLQVSATQESTLASARGLSVGTCESGSQAFVVETAVPDSRPAFGEGTALACGLLLTGQGANIAHAVQWCRFIEIQKAR